MFGKKPFPWLPGGLSDPELAAVREWKFLFQLFLYTNESSFSNFMILENFEKK